MAVEDSVGAGRSWRRLNPAAVPLATWAWSAAAVFGSAITLFLRDRVPFTLGPPSGQDAKLFVRQATALSRGHWLGTFDSGILSKGPAYPAFMAAMYRLHISLPLGEQLTWLLAAGSIAACVWVVTRSVPIAVVSYLAIAFDPTNFSSSHAVVIRDGWYQSISLLFIGLFFLVVHAAVAGMELPKIAVFGVFAGLTGGAFWLCREEGSWILPSVAVIAVGLPMARLWRRYRGRRESPITRREFLRRFGSLALALLTVGLAFASPIAADLQLNKSRYGVALTNDMTSGQFARAYADWSRVIAGPARLDLPISRAQREAVYAVSPGAREMEASMESPRNPWYGLVCRNRPLADCDLSGALIGWALRSSASVAGHFDSEADFQDYFRVVADEIERACNDRALHCRAKLPPQLQPLTYARTGVLLDAMRASTLDVYRSVRFYELPNRVRIYRPGIREQAAAVVRDFPSQSEEAARLIGFRHHIWPYRLLIAGYRALLPLLVLVAAVGVVAELVVRRSRASALIVLCLALLAGFVSRIFVFALINATQYRTVADVRYQLPTHAFMLAFAVVGSLLAARLIPTRWLLWRGRPTGAPTADTSDGPAAERPEPEADPACRILSDHD